MSENTTPKTDRQSDTGATSERAFIGAIAAALMNGNDETVKRALDKITEPEIILTEPAAADLFNLYRSTYRTGGKLSAFAPVEISGGRSEVRKIIDNCITTFNSVSDDTPDEYITRFISEYMPEYQAELHARLSDAIRAGDGTQAERIRAAIEGSSAEPKTIDDYSNDNLIDYFKNHDPATMRRPIKTGFAMLDKYTNGGLHDELYIINAGTSAGKTAFVMQIADRIAKTQPVIMFALEMSQRELMARSISRETYEYSADKYGDGTKYGRSQTEILDFDRYFYDPDEPDNKEYSNDETAVIEFATRNYSKYAHNIYTVETVGQVTIDDIRRTVTEFNKRFEKYNEQQKQQPKPRPIYPVIIVDYLQVMAPTDARMDERRKTDECIVGLKQISRDLKATVICISAISKSGYNSVIDIGSGKNSGGIEYTAGTVFGLQFYAQSFNLIAETYNANTKQMKNIRNKSNVDFNVEKSREPRYMELTVLKNRSGVVQDEDHRIILEYHAKYNYFEELKQELHETVKKQIQREYAAKVGVTDEKLIFDENYNELKKEKTTKSNSQNDADTEPDGDEYEQLFDLPF